MYVEAFLRRWWLLVLLPAIGVAIAYAASASASVKYQSVVTLQLNPAARSAFLPYAMEGGEVSALAASYGEVLRGRTFAEAAVRRLNLTIAPEVLARSINAQLVPNTNIFRLTVSGASPGEARALAQAIAELFISETVQGPGGPLGVPSRLTEMEETARSYPGRIAALRQQRDRLDQAVSRGDMSRLAELTTLEARLAALETSYANLLVEINRARGALSTASILDDATPGVANGAVPRSRALLFGLVSGLAVAIGVVLLLWRLDDTVRAPRDVAESSAAPLAVLGHARTSDRTNGAARLQRDPRDPTHEACRVLHANLHLRAGNRRCRTLLVTSPGPGEGKTFVACNLAIAMARAGRRVLLADANWRHPAVHQAFGVTPASGPADAATAPSGVSQHGDRSTRLPLAVDEHDGHVATVVLGEHATEARVMASPIANLWLTAVEPSPDGSAPFIGGMSIAHSTAPFSGDWDAIVLDAAPLLPVADTRHLVWTADAILVVARAGRTSRSALRECLALLSQVERPIEIVLNDFAPPRYLRGLP